MRGFFFILLLTLCSYGNSEKPSNKIILLDSGIDPAFQALIYFKESPFYTSGLPFAIGTYDANRSFKEVEFFKATISKSAHEFLINQDAMKLYDLKNNGVAKAVYDCLDKCIAEAVERGLMSCNCETDN